MINKLDREIKELYCKKQYSLSSISKKVGLGKETVRCRLIKLKIKRRTTKQCCKLKQCGFNKIGRASCRERVLAMV